MQAGHFLTESWILQSSQAEQAERNRSLFHQLLRSLVTEELHMVSLSLCLELISILKRAVTKGVTVYHVLKAITVVFVALQIAHLELNSEHSLGDHINL